MDMDKRHSNKSNGFIFKLKHLLIENKINIIVVLVMEALFPVKNK